MSPIIKEQYDKLEAALQSVKSTYVLQRVGFGKSQTVGGKDYVNGLVVEWRPGKRMQPKTGGLALKRSVPAIGQMTIECAEDAKIDQEMKDMMNATFESAVREFGATLSGTYQLTANSNFVPTEARFQALEGEKSFSIKKGE